MIQFDETPTAVERARLRSAGVVLLQPLGANAYFARVVNAANVADAPNYSIQPIQRRHKLHPALANGEAIAWMAAQAPMDEPLENPTIAAYVLFHSDVDAITDGGPLVQQLGGVVKDAVFSLNGLVVELPADALATLADDDAVMWIEPAMPELEARNYENCALTQADVAQAAPYNLDGAGVTAFIFDQGTVMETHVDFGGRVTVFDTADDNAHPTHVAGTIGGDGTASRGKQHGMAPAVSIVSASFMVDILAKLHFFYTNPGDIEADYFTAINTYGADVANNSIGMNIELQGLSCALQGDYGVTSSLIDGVIRGSLGRPIVVCWAAGNDRGTDTCPEDYHSMAPPSCAKNHITVGAVNANDDSMTVFSSWGPTDDGRLKPDVVAPGCQSDGDMGVTSTSNESNTAYLTACGTSMATPTATGCAALLIQDYRNQYPGQPDMLNSTVKALLIQTSHDVEEVGPDFRSGYGSIRVADAVDQMRSGSFVEAPVDQGDVYTTVVYVAPGDAQLKVTLAWDDPPAVPNVEKTLINDLDLEVYDAAGVRHFPWTLDPSNPSVPAVRTNADHVNNVEQVVIDAPTPGAYVVEVRGYNVPLGPQTFSLVASPNMADCATAGVVQFDSPLAACEGAVGVSVRDCNLNADPLTVEAASVTVASDVDAVGLAVPLVETGPDTGVFTGSAALSQTAAPGVVQVVAGGLVYAAYADADNGLGVAATYQDVATVACEPLTVANVRVDYVDAYSAIIAFDTNRPTASIVAYGASCAATDDEAFSTERATTHAIRLTELTPLTSYVFRIYAADDLSSVEDDNAGACYAFSTTGTPNFFVEDFVDAIDLSYTSITFTPNGGPSFYDACIKSITALPSDPTGGKNLGIGTGLYTIESIDDGHVVSIFEESSGDLFISGDGYVSFWTGDLMPSPYLATHFRLTRVSALFGGLDMYAGGTTSIKQFDDRVAVTWLNIASSSGGGRSTFQIEMFFDARIRVSYLGIGATGSIVGLSNGKGVPPDLTQVNLSALGECWSLGDLNCDGAVNAFDIDPFVAALVNSDSYALSYPACRYDLADINGDGAVNAFDIDPFVALLVQAN